MFVALMFTLLPLYYSDNYYNILNDKKDVYYLFAYILIAAVACSLMISLAVSIYKKQGKAFVCNIWQQGNALDIVMIVFALLAVYSTICSADIRTSLSGENAWGVGTWTILVSILVYFVISRCYTGKSDIWVYLYLGSFAVLAIGVIDRLGYDFLIMHDEIPLQYNIFISTIGNVNFWAAYLSIIVPFFMLATIFTRSRVRRACIYLFLLVAYFSLFITLTNTTYIGIGIAALFVVWYSFQKVIRLKNLAINGILFSVAGMVAEFLWKHPYTPRTIDTDTVSLILLQHRLYFLPGVAGVVILVALLGAGTLSEDRKKKLDCLVERFCGKIWIGLIIIGVIGTIYYLVCNYNLELFNYRGSIWYFAFHGFLDGNLSQKLIGAGPALLDTVTQAEITKADFYVEWNWLYCTAHNDVLEYLVTMGVFGAVLKILMYLLPYYMYAKGKERKPQMAAVLAALTGFIGQGLFTGPYILTYVIYVIFLGVLAAYYRMDKTK